jgi:hypothetical protein
LSFVINDLSFLPTSSHSLPLVTYLAYPNTSGQRSYREEAKWRVREIRRALRQQYKQQRERESFEQLLSYVIWPPKVRSLLLEEITEIRRRRTISKDSKGKSGCYFSQKLGREVQYESQLEWEFLLSIEELQSVVFYQEQPFAVPYEFGHQSYKYYPDILLVLEDGKGIVVEIKPVFQMALHRNLAKWSALRKFCDVKGIGILVTDGRRTIQQLQQQEIDADFAQAVLTALQCGPLSWNEYREIKEKYNVDRNSFLALVLRKRLIWELSPFKPSLPY